MPTPVNSNWRKRSITDLRLTGMRAPYFDRCLGLPRKERPSAASIVEIDVLVVDDIALVVSHDVVAVQAVAVLVEIVFAFGAGVFLRGQDRLADLAGIGSARLVDGRREDGDRVIGP